jgi:hypothetical protein
MRDDNDRLHRSTTSCVCGGPGGQEQADGGLKLGESRAVAGAGGHPGEHNGDKLDQGGDVRIVGDVPVLLSLPDAAQDYCARSGALVGEQRLALHQAAATRALPAGVYGNYVA